MPYSHITDHPPSSGCVASLAARVQQILEIEYQTEYRRVYLAAARGENVEVEQRELEARALCTLFDVQVRVEIGTLLKKEKGLLVWKDPDDDDEMTWFGWPSFLQQEFYIEYSTRSVHRERIVHQQVRLLQGTSPVLSLDLLRHVFTFLSAPPENESGYIVDADRDVIEEDVIPLFDDVIPLRWERHNLRPDQVPVLHDSLFQYRERCDIPAGPLWPRSMFVSLSLSCACIVTKDVARRDSVKCQSHRTWMWTSPGSLSLDDNASRNFFIFLFSSPSVLFLFLFSLSLSLCTYLCSLSLP